MEPTTIIRKPASFRFRADLLERLKRNAARENRTLAEKIRDWLHDLYHEPNAVTKAAIEEAMNRKDYPTDEVYDSVEDLFKALDTE